MATCVACGKEYNKNRSGVIRCSSCVNKAKYARKKELLDELRVAIPCQCCGETDPVVKQFHHITTPARRNYAHGGKHSTGTATMLSNGTYYQLLKEIEKCIMLCANCHLKAEAGSIDISHVPTIKIPE